MAPRPLVPFALFVVLALLLARAATISAAGTPPAFVFERGGDLFAMTVDGSRTVRLKATKLCECDARLSYDGRFVAYVRARGVRRGYPLDADGLWTMRVDGTGRTRLTSNGSDRRPAWSPDRQTIYFERTLPPLHGGIPCTGLFRIGSDGRGVSRLTSDGLGHEYGVAAAPDSWHLAYVAWTACEGGTAYSWLRIWHLTRSGWPIGRPVDLYGDEPAWSPDSRQLAVIDGLWEPKGLAVMNRDGSRRRLIVSRKTRVRRPAWSPDGQWVMFASDGDILLVRPDGSERRRMTRTRTVAETPVGWVVRLP